MKIFLAHDVADEPFAAAAQAALEADRHTVLRRSGRLVAGRTPTEAVRNSINASDYFLFVATPTSTAKGAVAFSDLVHAHARWRDPKGRILVVSPAAHENALNDEILLPFTRTTIGDDVDAIVRRVAETAAPPVWQPKRIAAPVAALLALIIGGSLAYWFSAGTGRDAAVVDGSLEFDIPIDYTDTVSFGESRTFKLVQTAGPAIRYRCKVGPAPNSNIARIEHDETCSQIRIVAADGPFVDEQGQPYDRGYIRPDRDFLPVVVESHAGKEIYRTDLQFRVSNSITNFLLRGLKKAPDPEPSRYSIKFVVTPGERYDLQILTPTGFPVPTSFKCSPNRQRSDTKNVTVSDDCRLVLQSAVPGYLTISISNGSGFADDLLFDLVAPSYREPVRVAPPPKTTETEMEEGNRSYRKWVAGQIEQREADRKMGVPYAQDTWYVEMLKQTLGELDTTLNRADRK